MNAAVRVGAATSWRDAGISSAGDAGERGAEGAEDWRFAMLERRTALEFLSSRSVEPAHGASAVRMRSVCALSRANGRYPQPGTHDAPRSSGRSP